MRGLKPNAKRLREIRQLAKFTQAELAIRAGVGERTIRNAEAGRTIRHDFLRFIAEALGVTPLELVADREELLVAKREQANADHVIEALAAFVDQGNPSELAGLLAPSVRLHIAGPDIIPLAGEYRGVDGFRRLLEIDERTLVYERPMDLREVRASGKFVILSGFDHMRILSTNKSFSARWHHIQEFDQGRIVRIDVVSDLKTWVQAMTP